MTLNQRLLAIYTGSVSFFNAVTQAITVILMLLCIMLLIFVFLLVTIAHYKITAVEFIGFMLVIPPFLDFYYFKWFCRITYNKLVKPLSNRYPLFGIIYQFVYYSFAGEIYNVGLIIGSGVFIYAIYINRMNLEYDQLGGLIGAILFILSMTLYLGDFCKWYEKLKREMPIKSINNKVK